MRKRRVVASVLAVSAIAGCTGSTGVTATVPVTQEVPDTTYVLGPEATVTSEEYSEGPRGVVTVQARRGDSTTNKTPSLEGQLILRDGQAVPCSMFRSWVWGSFTNFEGLKLKCVTDVDPTSATRFDITG